MNWISSYCLFIIITCIYIGQNCLVIQFAEHTYQSPTIDLRETLSQRKATESKSIGLPNALLMQKIWQKFWQNPLPQTIKLAFKLWQKSSLVPNEAATSASSNLATSPQTNYDGYHLPAWSNLQTPFRTKKSRTQGEIFVFQILELTTEIEQAKKWVIVRWQLLMKR